MIRPRAARSPGGNRFPGQAGRFVRPVGRSPYESGFGKGRRHGYARGYAEGLKRGRSEAGTPFDGMSIVLTAPLSIREQARLLESVQANTKVKLERISFQDGPPNEPERLEMRDAGVRLGKSVPASCRINQGLRLTRGLAMLIWYQPAVEKASGLDGVLELLPQNGLLCTTRGHDVGEALLLHRSTWERIGYLDEGYATIEERLKDYALRARLLGMPFLVADSEGHHGLELERLSTDGEECSGRFTRKWGPFPALAKELQSLEEELTLRSTDLYPTHFIAQGPTSLKFWIEEGVRYPILGEWTPGAVRLSRIDLLQLPKGEELPVQDIEQRLATLSFKPSSYGLYAEGILLRSPGGRLFQSQHGKLRRFVGELALADWQLDRRTVFPITEEEADALPRGLPIVAPPALLDPTL